ncbi:MAG: hypothetical protein AAGU27_08640 [Dehalobacterium sp.]
MKEQTYFIQFANKLFVWALIAYILLYLLSTMVPRPTIFELQSAMGFIILTSAFLILPKRGLILPILLIMLSLIIVGITSSSPVVLWVALREMKAIITLIILISLVSWIVGHRPYVKALMAFGQKSIKTPTRFFSFVWVLTYFISSFMTNGGIVFVYQMFCHEKKAIVSELEWDFTLSTAIMRGYTLTALWSIVQPAFAYVIVGTHAPLLPTMVKGFGLGIIGFLISALIYRIQLKPIQISPDLTPELSKRLEEQLDGLVWKFLMWLSFMLVGIFIANHLFHMDILLSVPVVIVIITTLYFVSTKSMFQYKKLWLRLITVDLGQKKKELFVILSAGLLVGTLKETGYGQVLFSFFLTVVNYLNMNIFVGLTLVVVMLGFCGFPPVPAMVLLSGILGNFSVNYSPDLIALSLLLGVSVTVVIAPITIPLLLISSLNGRSTLENGFRWNIMFGILLLIIGQIYIQLLALFN